MVGLLDKNAELLHMPLPHEKVMYLLAYSPPTDQQPHELPDTTVSESCPSFVLLPSKLLTLDMSIVCLMQEIDAERCNLYIWVGTGVLVFICQWLIVKY